MTAYAALAENLPSGSAYRPGDVLRHYGGVDAKGKSTGTGKTVHVLNTDAEGRLVLADAIVRAVRGRARLPAGDLHADRRAGRRAGQADDGRDGHRRSCATGSPNSARQVGEGGWAMPLPEHLREGLDSPLADLQNIAGDPGGGMLVAGHYLAEFVADGRPAGPTWTSPGRRSTTAKPYGYTASGGTGVPVRTLLAVLGDIASDRRAVGPRPISARRGDVAVLGRATGVDELAAPRR